MNHHFRLARYGFDFNQIIRIASRLALHTGINRLIWVNKKGRAHIIAEGVGGYQHTEKGIIGHCPKWESVDFQNAGLCEFRIGE